MSGSEQKKIKKVENVNELPKEFRRKIEEWHVIKDATSTPTAQDAPDSFTAAAPKASKGNLLSAVSTRMKSYLKTETKEIS